MRPQNTTRQNQIRRLLESGKTQTETARILGTSQSNVSRYAEKIGLRPGQGARRGVRREHATDLTIREIQDLARRFVARELGAEQ